MTKSFRRVIGVLTVLLLGVLPAVNPLEESLPKAQAATAGSGVCAQVVDDATEVQVDFDNGDCVVQFKRAATTNWTVPAGVRTIQFLVVGGGASGNRGYCSHHWGGGGGGGAVAAGSYTFSTDAGTLAITVGAGGQGETSASCGDATGNDGGSSSLGSLITAGGGSAGTWNTGQGGSSGATSGVPDGDTPSNVGAGYSTVADCSIDPYCAAGGGGGAGGPAAGLNGGDGLASSITGVSLTYGAGGAGRRGPEAGTPYLGTVDSGGGTASAPARANSGAGGADQSPNIGAGADGIVVVRYAIPTRTSSSDFALDTQGDAYASGENVAVIPTGTSSDFTVEMWLKPQDLSGGSILLSQGKDDETFYLKQSGASLVINHNNLEVDTGYDFTAGRWVHLAQSVDASDSSAGSKVYINGQLVHSSSGTRKAYSLDGSGAKGFHIAALSRSDGEIADAQYDQVKIWNSALTQEQLQTSMNSWGNTGITGATLVSHYDFNDNSQASVLFDQAGYNNLVLHNSATNDYMPLAQADTSSSAGNAIYKFERSYLTSTGGWTVPSGIASLELLTVGGGGGGERDGGGGGGGGESRYSETYNAAGSSYLAITIGTGGRGGSNSVATAGGGGSSAVADDGGTIVHRANGGSGADDNPWDHRGSGGAGGTGGTGGTGTDGGDGGYAAGNQPGETDDNLVGYNGAGGFGGPGEDGPASSITGTELHYGGGGGGGVSSFDNSTQENEWLTNLSRTLPIASPSGGSGGGGPGATVRATNNPVAPLYTGTASFAGVALTPKCGNDTYFATTGFAGADGYGGGGGGGTAYGTLCGSGSPSDDDGERTSGGDGGSGVVIIRYSLSPGAPTGLTGTAGDGQVALSWTAPSHVGSTSLTDYIIEYNDGSAWATFSDDVSTATSTTVTGLTNGTSYTFRVSAKNSDNRTGPTSAATGALIYRAPQSMSWSPGPTFINTDLATEITLDPAPTVSGGVSISYAVTSQTGSASCTISDGSAPTVSSISGEGTCVITATSAEGAYQQATATVTLTIFDGAGSSSACDQRASGLTMITSEAGDDCVISFRSHTGASGTWYVPEAVTSFEYLVVGGGGGGGANYYRNNRGAGGGGAGGLLQGTKSSSIASSYTIEVGPGGAGGTLASSYGRGQSGSPSVAFGLTAYGGGGGGGTYNSGTYGYVKGLDGGSGGGGGSYAGTGGSGRSGQGNAGGRAPANTSFDWNYNGSGGGGGGGAGGAGQVSTFSGGTGGVGVRSDISGLNLFYAGGGGGAGHQNQERAAGGNLVGGWGGNLSTAATDGMSGRGGGGGGARAVTGDSSGGNGGSGVVIVRYTRTAQTALSGSASPSTIAYGESAALSTSGGSGTGAVTYSVSSGDCEISGSTLTATGTSSTCQIRAVKAGDANFAPGTATTFNVSVATSTITVTFKSNYPGGETDSTQTIYSGYPTGLTANSFARSGYSFSGWDTAQLGGGTPYTNGQSVTIRADTSLYAQWDPDSLSVTWNTKGGSSISATSVDTGANLTAPSNPNRSGFDFLGWAATDGGAAVSFPYAHPNTADFTMYAIWRVNNYAIAFQAGDDGSGLTRSTTKMHGTTLVLPDSSTANSYFTRTGYTVTAWSVNSDGSTSDYALGGNYTDNAGDILYPAWTANTYTITFNKGSLSGAAGADQTAIKTHDSALTLPNSVNANNDFTKTGYTVTAWSTNPDGSTTDYSLGGSYTTEAADTLYPVWTPDTYTVSYTYNGATGGNSVSSVDYTVDGILVALPNPTKTGYTFAGWYSNVGLTTSAGAGGASYTPSDDVTLYAKWDTATFTVIYAYNGATGGNDDDDDQYTTGNTAITLPTPTKEGYNFSGWYSDAAQTASVGAAGEDYSPTSNLTIYAKWTAITRSVAYSNETSGVDLSTSGSVPVDSRSYIIGDTVVVKANSGSLARTGYTFEGWVTNSNGTGTALNAGETVSVDEANITFYPKWAPATFTITYHKNGASGSLAKASDSYTTEDPNVTLPGAGTMSKTGYTFGGWSTSPTGADVGATYNTTVNVTLYAVWTIKSITYSYAKGQTSGGASLSSFAFSSFPTGATRNFGTSITLLAPDVEIDADRDGVVDHKFFGWSDGTSVYSAGATYVLGDTNPTFTAQWTPVYSVRYSLAGGSHASGDAATDAQCLGANDTCDNNQPITLNDAPSRTGYTFAGWKDQSDEVHDPGVPVTVTATRYLFHAQWTAIEYNMGFNSLGGSTPIANQTKTIGQIVTMPNPGFKTGYSFGGWSDGSTLFGIGSTFTVGSSSKSFTAQWIPDVYTVTYDWQGGSGSTPKASDSYTVGTGDMTLPTAAGAGYSRDGYTFSGWSTSIGGSVESGFRPTSDDVLYAVWADGNYTLTYDEQGGSVISTTASIARTTSTILATPNRANFTHVGWYTAATGGTKVGDAGDSYTPTSTTTLFARWVQDSLYGVDEATLETASTQITADGVVGNDQSARATSGSSRADVVVPGGSLPDGTIISIRYFRDTNRQSSLISGDNAFFFSVLVSWLYGSGTSATVPDTHPSRPIEVTLTNSAIKAGARVYQVIGTQVTDLGVAVADGSVTVELYSDPQLVVAATAPSAPTAVTGSAGDTRATISWTASSTGGSPLTGYTVTANPGGATCSTSTTSCTIGSLTNNTAYTFTVRATNGIGTSSASTASSAVTPVGANYTVTFDSNSGSAVADGSFFSGSTVSEPSTPTRSGYTFQGWSTTLDDDTTKVTFPYAPGVTSAITLYALWEVAPPAPASRGSSEVAAAKTVVPPGLSRIPIVLPSRVIGPTQPVVPPRPFSAPVVISPQRGFDPDAGAQARVGGLPATVTKTAPVPGAVNVGVGRVEVGITPQNPSNGGRPAVPAAPTDVSVSSGQAAVVAGGGLLPGSQLQVWLPGLNGSTPKELARIPVKTDGTFESELTFSARASEAPVPIGRQVIQVTGFDELGNQTVVDMTIMISQGNPAPERDRANNVLPDLSPGQSLATSGGMAETVTIQAQPETREVAVVSGDWNFNVSLPVDAGEVAQASAGATITLVQAKTASVSGEGFQPGTRVDIWLFSDPTLLASVTVLPGGDFSGEVFLDARYAVVGEHTLQLQGVGTDGFIKAANLGVVVQEQPATEPASSANWLLWFMASLLAAVVLVGMIALARRRHLRA